MSHERYQLVIGNKNTSSWSLRPWLALRRFRLPFEEININLRADDKVARILEHSPSGKVPALLIDDLVVWDSLAILETIADRHPEAGAWPLDREARAIARAVSAEMHSGFQALREHCPMSFLAYAPKAILPDPVTADIRRIVASWRNCRARYGGDGPFLFSTFSAADAMYAPVASRFRTYIPDLAPFGDDGTAQAWVDTIFAMPEIADWEKGALAEIGA